MGLFRRNPDHSLVVYTSIFGGYDQLQEPVFRSKNCDYVCFTDNPDLKSDFWTIRVLSDDHLSPARLSRRPKILPHLYFPEYEASLYLDGNLLLRGDVRTYVETYARTSPMLCVKHGERDCIYEEYAACRQTRRDNASVMQRQIERYRREGMPAHFGLIVGSFIYRRHHDPSVVRLMEQWWQEFSRNSQRDQLSFTYCCWKQDFHYDLYYGNNWSNDYFLWLPHQIAGNSLNLAYHRAHPYTPGRMPEQTAPVRRALSDRARMPAKFYVDFGQGLSEANVIFIAPEMDGMVANYCLYIPTGARTIRFDPIEGSQVAISGLQAWLDADPLDLLPANGERKNGLDWFTTTDPQYVVSSLNPAKSPHKLVIQMVMQVLDSFLSMPDQRHDFPDFCRITPDSR